MGKEGIKMELFSEERIGIKRIRTVEKYKGQNDEKNVSEFSVSLSAYELIYTIEGESKVIFGDMEIFDRPGTIRFLPVGKTDGRYTVERIKSPFSCIDVYFDSDSPLPTEAMCLDVGDKYRDKFIRLYNVWKMKEVGYYASAMMLLYEIIANLQRENRQYVSSSGQNRMKNVRTYIMRHFADTDFDYKALCRESGLKYSHFSVLFSSTYGMSPVKYVTKTRIDYAKELLITGRYAVTEIAEMCGFSDVYYFSSVFKRQTGISPSEYRRSL